ncbi:endonuclease/exonuclease/phosphatase family protein [Ferruginibacter sp.]
MRIITWNCNMAFRKKAAVILKYKPDILIVPECEHPDKLQFADDVTKPNDMVWIGENRNKGLGIFSYSDLRFKLHKTHNPELKLIAPVKIFNDKTNIMLFAIWANNPADKDGPYVTQVWKALQHYSRIIRTTNTILTGDFNSNTIWDRPRREGNHSTVVQRLGKKKIYSTYHKHFLQEQGKEMHPTYYLYKHQQKPYHLDYCFASGDLINKLRSVEVGNYEEWIKYSDHVPVIVHFNDIR